MLQSLQRSQQLASCIKTIKQLLQKVQLLKICFLQITSRKYCTHFNKQKQFKILFYNFATRIKNRQYCENWKGIFW